MPAPGTTDLNDLLRTMSPILDPETYLFVNFHTPVLDPTLLTPPPPPPDDARNAAIQMLFRETESWTGIVTEAFAQQQHHGLETMFPCRRITLNVYSSLDAVGFLAAITTKLAGLRIGVNPVSACLHDHLFVPTGTEEDVMKALREMVRDAEEEEGKRKA